MGRKSTLLGVMLLLASGLLACSATDIRPEQTTRDGYITLSSSTSIGQTFSAFYAGLEGIVLYLDTVQPGDGEILLHLRRSPQDSADLRSATLKLDQISTTGEYSFKFPPLAHSQNSDYYLFLELSGTGQVDIGTGENQKYLLGSLYLNGQPQETQIYFGLLFRTIAQWSGLFREALTWWGWILIGTFLFVLPGWALLKAFWPNWNGFSFWEKFGMGSGVGLAIYPVLLVLSDLINLKMGVWYAWIPGVFAAVFLVWNNTGALGDFRTNEGRERLKSRFLRPLSPFPWEILILSFLVILIFATRFWAIRTVDVPMWGDSVQHTVMAQLILDQKGLFTNWEPYAPYHSLTVHFGFPDHTALFSWLTGLPSHKATLIVSQWINAIAVITLIPLAYRLSPKNGWAAASTVLFAGLLSPMPAFYVNWGRFAQLDGQAILPVGILLTWDIFERARRLVLTKTHPHDLPQWKWIGYLFLHALQSKEFWFSCLITGLMLAGMTLTYYRTVFYYATIFPGLLIGWILSRKYRTIQEWISLGLSIAAIGSISFLFLAPWLKNLIGSSLSEMMADGMNSGSISNLSSEVLSLQVKLQAWLELDHYLSWVLIIASIIAFLWSISRKRWDVTAVGIWLLTLQAYHLSSIFQLPGANMLQVFAILIWVYMPVSLLLGWMVGEISSWSHRKFPNAAHIALSMVLMVFALVGANSIRLIATPVEFGLAVRPDLRAMAWIQKNVPENAHFLVEGYRIYNGRSIVGSDAGWWISYFTKRQNTMPPQYALLNETPNSPKYPDRMLALVTILEDNDLTAPESLTMLCNEKITHIYIGQRKGLVGAGASQLFSPEELINHSEFSLIYHQDGVYIFALNQNICRK